MNEPKYVDKICPILGSHAIPSGFHHEKLKAISLQSIEFQTMLCQKERCQLWDEENKSCSIAMISKHIDNLLMIGPSLEEALNHIERAIRALKEVLDGNS